MSKRFAWLLGVVVLVSIGVLVACGSSYKASSDGLVLVGSQGSGLIETFSFSLGSGHVSAIGNPPSSTASSTCALNGLPSSIVVDPAGAFAYAIINASTLCPGSKTGILAFKVNSDGTTAPAGAPVSFAQGSVMIQGTATEESVPVVPGALVMDPAGKFLFIADRATTDYPLHNPGLYVPGSVSVFAIGNGGGVTEVPGSPFFTSVPAITLAQSGIDIAGVAPTPTVFPPIGLNGVQNAVCSAPGINPPTSQYLYAVDKLGDQVFQFQVDTSTGVLTPQLGIPPVSTDTNPVGVAVDPCNRFVYVSNSLTNKISAYTMCNGSTTQSATCPALPRGWLVPVAGSPFSLVGSVSELGPLVVDPFGNNIYVLGTTSNTVSSLKISPVSGSLAPVSPPTVATGLQPTSIAVRADDNWLFVTNFNGLPPSVSQYAITPATGALTVQQPIPTDNYPWGVAVK